jgi:glyoxylase-like metal-dependent hydrolase (beta-lactamase superfamily II)
MRQRDHVRWIGAAAAVVLAAGIGGPAAAQTDRVVQMDTLNVRDVLYHLGGGGGNGLALIDEINGGVVLIDTKRSGWGEAVREAVEQVTDLPVTTIINTHAHEEHAGSNAEFPDAVTIVAHANARAAMLRDGLYAEDGPGLPTTTFTDRFSLLEDIDRIELYHFGPAHTDGDVVVVFPEKGVAYVGGLFPAKVVPVIDLERGGSGLAFPDALDRAVAATEGVARVITGHGPFPTTYAGRGRRERGAARAWSGFLTWDDLAEYAEFTRDLVTAVEREFSAGSSAGDAAAALRLPDRYAGYDLTGLQAAVDALYAELTGRGGGR